MPKYVTIGYGDQVGYEKATPAKRDEAHRHDAQLRAQGALIGVAGEPVQVRNHDGGGVRTADGAFMRADLPVAGFAVIDASSIEDAVAIASRTPCAIAYGVVEVWPLERTS